MGTPVKDITIKDDAPSELLLDKHSDYLVSYSSRKKIMNMWLQNTYE